MKKLIFIAVFLLGIIFTANSQDIARHALGVRLGDNDGFGSEISYQHELGEMNRLEVDLGFRNNKDSDAFKLTGIYQWVWNIDGGFNWYAGFGAGIGSWQDNTDKGLDDGLFINADGNIGIEYDFDIPLLISLDFRPEFDLLGNYKKNTDFDIALSLRYQF
ncbi:MAG TPA: hypothetical protein VIN72_10705 [Lutibacter sp.]